MVEDYAIIYHTGRSVFTGSYEIAGNGRRVKATSYEEFAKTPIGEIPIEEWREKAKAEIIRCGESALLADLMAYCREHCAWLHKEKDVEEYAIEVLCSRSYLHWRDFGRDYIPTSPDSFEQLELEVI